MDTLLTQILTKRRCYNSNGELQFMTWLHSKIKTLGFETKVEALGCVVVECGKSKVMFSCHTDTVHSLSESNASPTQDLFYDEALGHAFLNDKTASCLGADDGAGIYIMLKMLEAKIPGTYVFHRGEERGCLGSREILKTRRDWLEKFDACIAFDRPDNTEVVISQSGLSCASETYGKALAGALNALNTAFSYDISTKGVITDSKIYAYVIPECINLGVGYGFQHSSQEFLDVEHLKALTTACIALEWDKLPVTRVPPEEPALRHFNPFNGGVYNPPPSSLFRDVPSTKPKRGRPAGKKDTEDMYYTYPKKGKKVIEPDLKLCAEIEDMNYEELLDFVGDSELAKAFVHIQAKAAAAEAKAKFLIRIMGLDV